MAAFYRSSGGRCIPVLWRLWRDLPQTSRASTSNAWRTMLCGGEAWVKALAYCRQAGEKAIARSAYREAPGYFGQALGALPHLLETRDTHEQAIDLRLALRTALFPLGDLWPVLACLREAETLAEALGDHRRLGQVSRFLSDHFRNVGAYDQAIADAQCALALATASGDSVLHALANRYLGGAYYSTWLPEAEGALAQL